MSTSRKHKTPLMAKVFLGLIALALLAVVFLGFTFAGKQLHEQGASSLRKSIIDASMQCFAIEGAYPQSVKYLEDHYGIQVNHSIYVVNYEIFASNVMPSVEVVVK